jgi:hypothetical protein
MDRQVDRGQLTAQDLGPAASDDQVDDGRSA